MNDLGPKQNAALCPANWFLEVKIKEAIKTVPVPQFFLKPLLGKRYQA